MGDTTEELIARVNAALGVDPYHHTSVHVDAGKALDALAERVRRYEAVALVAQRCRGYGLQHLAHYGLSTWMELCDALAALDTEESNG